MKIQACVAVFISLFICQSVGAHSGRLDGRGGHNNRKTGEYHYHQGQKADSKSTDIKSTKPKSERKTEHEKAVNLKKKKKIN